MKTLRMLLVVFVVLCMTNSISNAQDKKTTETYSWPWIDWITCTNEYIDGEESCVVTTWDGKYKCRYEGIYKGQSSGKTYTMFAIENGTAKGGKASNESFIFKAVLKCDGVPIAIGSFKFHATTNAIGDITVEKEMGAYWVWVCL